MKKRRNNANRASTLQVALSAGLISISAILFAIAAPAKTEKAPQQDRSGSQLAEGADAIAALGNYPNISILLSTNTTVTPDAAPTNTTSINISTSTNFKGKLEGYPATGLVRVTDAHPAGTYTVTVRAFNGAFLTATTTFTLTVTTTNCTPMIFAAATNFSAGTTPHSVTVGDFNGDNKQDLAFGSQGTPFVAILLGDGAGNFGAPTNFAAGTAESIAVGDFNGDGKQDLVTANLSSANVSILLGDGAGNFSAPTSFGAGSRPSAVAVGDFNGDGKQDLAVANDNSFNVSILLGDGAGNFSAATNFGVGRYPDSIAVGDFNGDGKQDLAVTNSDSNTVSILLGTGDGNFNAAINFSTGSIPQSVAVGDFNGDGKQDLAVANSSSNTVSIFLGNGAGSFSARTDFPGGGDNLKSIAVGDFNGDGKQDLATANYNSSRLSLLMGNGTGSFGAAINFNVGSVPDSVAVGDFNGDGRQDLAVANGSSGTVSIVMRQQCPAPTPTATATATASPTATATATGTPPPIPTLGNYPDTSVPLSTDATVPPDAPPNNTTSINVSTSTSFQGRLEADPMTGVVRVTDAHPAGTYTVTVRAFNGGGPVAIATRTFILTVTTPPACSPLSFAAVNYCAGNFNASAAVVGDFNGDGKQDLAVAYYTSAGFISILLGDGGGHFSAPTSFSAGAYPRRPVVGDFNGDGKQDLAVSNSGGVSVLFGDGSGSFSPPSNISVGGSASRPAVGDFNGDGKQDLAVTVSNHVSILLGDGTGNFSAGSNIVVGNGPGAPVVGDFNRDSKQDLVVTNSGSNSVSILLGDGFGNFSVPLNFDTDPGPSSVVVGDFNGDGKQDLAVNSYGPNTLSILLGDGAGHFGAPTAFGASSPYSVVVGDFNGDGAQDLAVANYGGSAGVSIFLGDGAGHFGTPTNFYPGGDPYSIAVGDFNGDGMQDLAVGQYSATVSILLRGCPGETPTPTATATATGTPPPPPTLGNYPDRAMPLSTDTTVTPDAAPSNTTSINASTSTNFKGKLEGNPATGAVRVTDAHPAGTYTVMVRAFNAGGLTATKTFTLTVTTPAICNPLSFAGGTFGVSTSAESVTVGDFNGDGKQDLATANDSSNNVSILLGDGAGHFSPPTNFSAAISPRSIAVGDFNGDGNQDLAVANYGASCMGTLSILLGDGAGHFGGPTNYTVNANTFHYSLAVGDFNADGRQDLAVGNNVSNNVSIFLGNAEGHFNPATNFGAGTNPYSVAVGDFNGDGKQDLAVANYSSSNVSILLGDGAGNFSAPTNLGVGNFPYSIAVGDFNDDSRQDLAVANHGSNNISIFLGNGAGNFSAATNVLVDCGPYSVAIGDFNGDGKQDLAVTNDGCNGTSNASILLGDGAGNFSAPVPFAAASGPHSVVVGDFNGDGMQDLAVANHGSTTGSILLRSCAPTPTATPTATATVSPCPPVITQSSSQAITTTWEPCRYGNTGHFAQTDNSYWRAFNMATFVGGAQYNVSSVSFGVSSANATQPVIVRLYANNGASFPGGTRTLIGTSMISVSPGQGGTVVTTPLVATVPAGTLELVMELFTPDGIHNGYVFHVGANTAPETGPSYWSSVCNSTPQVINSHLVFNVQGSCTAPAPTPAPTSTLTPTPIPTSTPTFTPTPTPTPSPTGCDLAEGFENITTLAGWVTQNNSRPVGTTGWFQGNSNFGWFQSNENFAAQSGSPLSYIASNFVNGSGLATISNWLLTPTVNLQNGAKFSFWTRTGTSPVFPDRLQVRMSSNGMSSNVGTQPTDVGDFTTLLLDINPTYTTGGYSNVWTNYIVTISGLGGPLTGRLAFRYFVENGGPSGTNSDYIGIDAAVYDCNGNLPVPTGTPTPTPAVTPTPGTPTEDVSGTILYCSSPLSNVRVNVTGTVTGSRLSDGSGNYLLRFLPWAGNYTVTPSKAPISPGAMGISTVDAIAIQRHFLNIAPIPPGCRLTAADVNGDSSINTLDTVAILRFFLQQTTGLANVGKYQFTPVSRQYVGVGSNQTAQNYDTVILGDVAAPFVSP